LLQEERVIFVLLTGGVIRDASVFCLRILQISEDYTYSVGTETRVIGTSESDLSIEECREN
jgi:hypothetical protein